MTFTVDDTGVAVISPAYGDGESLPAYEHVIERLRSRAGHAEPWHIALLDAIGRWSLTHEELAWDEGIGATSSAAKRWTG